MLVRINTVEGEYILDIDVLSESLLKRIIDNVKREWTRQFMETKSNKEGRTRYYFKGESSGNSWNFSDGEDLDHCLEFIICERSLYREMPLDLIKEKFREEGLTCRIIKPSKNKYYL